MDKKLLFEEFPDFARRAKGALHVFISLPLIQRVSVQNNVY